MRRTLHRSLTISILLCSAVSSFADRGGQPAAYLSFLAGARPMGMGGAFTAVANDVTANFFNAAALAEIEDREAIFQHANLSLDRNFNYLAAVWPYKRGQRAIGVSYTRFNVDGIPETRIDPATGLPQVDGAGHVIVFSLFNDVEEAFTLSQGYKIHDRMYAGLTARVLHQDLFGQAATGLGMDASYLWQPTDDVRLGLKLGDMFESLRWNDSHRDKVPFNITTGVAVRGWQAITYATDINWSEGDGLLFRVGAEKWWKDHYAARVGFNDGDFSLGAGARFRAFQFDYAYQTQTLGDINRISLIYRF